MQTEKDAIHLPCNLNTCHHSGIQLSATPVSQLYSMGLEHSRKLRLHALLIVMTMMAEEIFISTF